MSSATVLAPLAYVSAAALAPQNGDQNAPGEYARDNNSASDMCS